MESKTQPDSLQKAPASALASIALLAKEPTAPAKPPASALASIFKESKTTTELKDSELAVPTAVPEPAQASALTEPETPAQSKTNIILLLIIIILVLLLVSLIILSIVTPLQIIKYKNILDEKAEVKTNNIDTNSYKGIEYVAYVGFGGFGTIIFLLFITFLMYMLKINYFENYKGYIFNFYLFIFIIYIIIIISNTVTCTSFKSIYEKHLKDIDDKLLKILQYITLGLIILTFIIIVGFIIYFILFNNNKSKTI
jgi:flagellar basal body-associated protein FliL